MAIKIDKNIHLPTGYGCGDAVEIRQVFQGMEVSDSFFIADDPTKKSQQSNLIYRARRAGIRVSTRKAIENGVDGFRVWRVK